jgi:D-glycero-D-manno-heptose 1,7-bisphosphate phosphatase
MRRGLLLDRDGVINVDHGYVGRREQFIFMPGLFPFLRAAEDRGFRLAILTNQAGVARGYYTRDDFDALTQWMLGELQREGVTVELVLGCCEHPEGSITPYVRESFWRKPNPGMILEAVHRLNLDPARSAFLGDQMRDMDAARAGGIKRLLLLNQAAMAADDVVAVRSYDEALAQLIALA